MADTASINVDKVVRQHLAIKVKATHYKLFKRRAWLFAQAVKFAARVTGFPRVVITFEID